MASASSGLALRIRIRRGLGGGGVGGGRGFAAAATDDGDGRGGRGRRRDASPVIVLFPCLLLERERKRESCLSGKRAVVACVRPRTLPPLPLRSEKQSERDKFGGARFFRLCVFALNFSLCLSTLGSIYSSCSFPLREDLSRFFSISLPVSLSSTPPNQPAMALASAAGRFLRGRRTAEKLAVGLAAAPAAAAAAGALSSLSSSSSPSAAPLAQHQQSRRASGHAENTNTFIREVRQESALCLRHD